jgi:hypothetical protein
MHIGIAVLLLICGIAYYMYSTKKIPVLSTPFPATWFDTMSDWGKTNVPYATTTLSNEDCAAGCLSDPICMTVTTLNTSEATPTNACNYYSTTVPVADIVRAPGSSGSIQYKKMFYSNPL